MGNKQSNNLPKVRLLILINLLIVFSAQSIDVHADDGPGNKERTTTITTSVTQYNWQLRLWSDDTVVCAFYIEHEDDPTDYEIQSNCTYQQFSTWKNTPACDTSGNPNTANCPGVYLFNLNSVPITRIVEVKLSPPTIWLSMTGCIAAASQDYCQGKPILVLSGEEPLPNESIVRISGKIGGESFSCDSNKCLVELGETGSNGTAITFQALSSFGDKSPEFAGFVRVVPVEGLPGNFYVDIISDQWLGKSPPSCSEIWQVFPESTELPGWLQTPQDPSEMNSSETLYYLAAALINNGVVDVSSCQDRGLENTYVANECGVTMAEPEIQYWQNQFDQEIFTVALMDGVPANLMKNIFIRESQLWPGIYDKIEEVGFGHLTENGADTALLWNVGFYNDFCPLVLDQAVCNIGFAQLSGESQNILKGALLQRTNAACPECVNGIDLTKANFSIHVFAETLKANCSQVGQIILNNTGKSPREVSSYSDLWRFTLLNYNAGAGCLSKAVYQSHSVGDPIDWEHVAASLQDICAEAVPYVVEVSEGNTEKIMDFSTPIPTMTPTVSVTSTPTVTATVTSTSEPTATLTSTPTPSVTPTE